MPGPRGFRFTLAARASMLAVLVVAASTAAGVAATHLLPGHPVAAALLAALVVAPIAIGFARAQLRPLIAMLRALGGTVMSYRDGDFSFGLHWKRNDEMGDLVDAHNDLGSVLREQRLDLVQRELLLDTMVQNTPVAMMLVDAAGNIVFANIAARHLLNEGRRIEGTSLDALLGRTFASLRDAMDRGGDGLFTARDGAHDEEIYHLARRGFTLNGKRHELLLLRHLTSELRRQEVQTWKKVIRVISHELNNSLAPIASLARSGAELLRRGNAERLPEVLRTIEERSRHLERFIDGYARFAKLPAPRIVPVEWGAFVRALQLQVPFKPGGELAAEAMVSFDESQMQQALLNLLKNAHESGSNAEDVTLGARRAGELLLIEVADRGGGMTEAVMANALVPFYSTKRSGTGLGLALAREIAEAHGGRIALHNREGGGLSVVLLLPA